MTQETRNKLLEHLFWSGVVGGILAGLAGMCIAAAFVLIAYKDELV